LDPLCGKASYRAHAVGHPAAFGEGHRAHGRAVRPLVKLSEAIVVWVWAINIEQGSLFRIQLLDPDRAPILDAQTRALEGCKANYLAYVGGKYGTRAGVYDMRVELLAGNRKVQSMTRSFERMAKIRRAIIGLARGWTPREELEISYRNVPDFAQRITQSIRRPGNNLR
jgi:hypothetical protein